MFRRLPAPLALLLLVASPALAQPAPGGPPAVGVVQAKKQPVTETSEFVGRIQAISRVDLVARVTAFLQERHFTEGAEVHTGDLLYKLERAEVHQAYPTLLDMRYSSGSCHARAKPKSQILMKGGVWPSNKVLSSFMSLQSAW